MRTPKVIALLLPKFSLVILWILLLGKASSAKQRTAPNVATFFSGSVNGNKNITEFCYNEGEAFNLNCELKNNGRKKIQNLYIWWMFLNDNGLPQSEAGIPDGYRVWVLNSPSTATLQLAKKYDEWVLKCYHGFKDNYNKYVTYGTMAVRFRLKQAGACQDAEYMSLRGAINYIYDRAIGDLLHYNYTENEWLNVTCSLVYPHEKSFLYAARYMWWTLKNNNETDESYESLPENVLKLTAISKSYTYSVKLSKKYDNWSLSCRHADIINNIVATNARQGTVKIILHFMEQDVPLADVTSRPDEPIERTESTNSTDDYQGFKHKTDPRIIIGAAVLLIALTAFVIFILLYYAFKKNKRQKEDNNGPTTYADLDFTHAPERNNRPNPPNSPYSEIAFSDDDEVGYATVQDKSAKNRNTEESPYAEINPYAEVSFKNVPNQQITDTYAKVLPKSQRNKQIENGPSKRIDTYASVMPKSERNKQPSKGHRDDVSNNAKNKFNDDIYTEIRSGNKSKDITYANMSKDCDLYENARRGSANTTYANVGIELNGKHGTAAYAKGKAKNDTATEQNTGNCAGDGSKNDAYEEIHHNERKKLIPK